jgi:hypothetical protein
MSPHQGFIDEFAATIDANVTDTISTSWGQWEYLDELPPLIRCGRTDLAVLRVHREHSAEIQVHVAQHDG